MRNPRPYVLHDQQVLIEALCNPALYPHAARRVQVIETHISWVLLVGHHAYKIKKAIDLGFLDFTELSSRKFYCEEELRLNRRYAAGLYEDVVCIGGTLRRPMLGRKPAIEYAVKMHRFDADKQLDRMLEQGTAGAVQFDALADAVARFHLGLPAAPADTAYGSPRAIRAPMEQNFAQLLELDRQLDLGRLKASSEAEFAACEALFSARRRQGSIRECHGDLHLGNIALQHGIPVPFDGLEFNPSFRWIDVINEMAFLAMDLLHRNRADLAFRVLNRYLETTGDYEGIGVLRFYLAYRAVVRAKIAAIRAHQHPLRNGEAHQAAADSRLLLALAELCLARRRPALIITHGLPGSGKTTVSQRILERLQAIRIRSDVERKRLFGLGPLDSGAGRDLYTPEATARTYDRLLMLASTVLDAGFPVIVDAAFLKTSERAMFRTLAQQKNVPFVILSVTAGDAVLRERIALRQRAAQDASEADLQVLEKLGVAQEPLAEDERQRAVLCVNDGRGNESGERGLWGRLETALAAW